MVNLHADVAGGVWSCESSEGAALQRTEGVVSGTGSHVHTTFAGQHAKRIDATLKVVHASFHHNASVRSQGRRIESAHVNGARGVGGVGEYVKGALAHRGECTANGHVRDQGVAVTPTPWTEILGCACAVRLHGHGEDAALGAAHHLFDGARNWAREHH